MRVRDDRMKKKMGWVVMGNLSFRDLNNSSVGMELCLLFHTHLYLLILRNTDSLMLRSGLLHSYTYRDVRVSFGRCCCIKHKHSYDLDPATIIVGGMVET